MYVCSKTKHCVNSKLSSSKNFIIRILLMNMTYIQFSPYGQMLFTIINKIVPGQFPSNIDNIMMIDILTNVGSNRQFLHQIS